jgi:tetraprenyl-beta-curcumene synthase
VCRPGLSVRPTRSHSSSRSDYASNPTSVSPRQLRALIASVTRELAWGLPAVSREVRRWRSLAQIIPDAPIREDAISALASKRGQADGAALFSILPRDRNLSFLRFLVAYQIIWDFLDSAHERAADGQNGRQLHLALVDAFGPGRPLCDYYRHHPWRDDGGYLRALVEVCRECCAALPSYERVRLLIVKEAMRAEVLAINHDLDAQRRDAALQAWAAEEFPTEHEALWFELTGAASAGLTIFALLALACEPTCSDEEIVRTCNIYMPWTSAVACMLDSYADQLEDSENGDHSYVAHYATPETATYRICLLVGRCLRATCTLKNSDKHVLIVASMVALYLTKDSARTLAMQDTTERIAEAAGSLTRALIPILRLWRVAYAQRST